MQMTGGGVGGGLGTGSSTPVNNSSNNSNRNSFVGGNNGPSQPTPTRMVRFFPSSRSAVAVMCLMSPLFLSSTDATGSYSSEQSGYDGSGHSTIVHAKSKLSYQCSKW